MKTLKYQASWDDMLFDLSLYVYYCPREVRVEMLAYIAEHGTHPYLELDGKPNFVLWHNGYNFPQYAFVMREYSMVPYSNDAYGAEKLRGRLEYLLTSD